MSLASEWPPHISRDADARDIAKQVAAELRENDNRQMDYVPRQELDLKLDLLQERINSFLQRVEDRDAAAERIQDARAKALDERDRRYESVLEDRIRIQDERDKRYEAILNATADLSRRAEIAAEKAADLKRHLWLSVLAQVVAILAIIVGAYFALQAFNVSLVDAIRGSYEMGKTAATQSTNQGSATGPQQIPAPPLKVPAASVNVPEPASSSAAPPPPGK